LPISTPLWKIIFISGRTIGITGHSCQRCGEIRGSGVALGMEVSVGVGETFSVDMGSPTLLESVMVAVSGARVGLVPVLPTGGAQAVKKKQRKTSEQAFFIKELGPSAYRPVDCVNDLQSRKIAPGPAFLHGSRIIKKVLCLGQVESVLRQTMGRQ
jgi:hypothetical protein